MTEEKLEQIKKNIAFNLGMAGAVNRISSDIVQEILREETELYEACKGLLSYQKNTEKVFEADRKKIEELELSLSGSTFCYDEEEHKELQQENKQLKELVYKDNTGALIITLNKEMELEERIDKAIEYNNHLIEHAKYHLNLGHLKKMNKILKGDSNE